MGAGVGPVPLGTEFCGAPVEVPGAPEVEPLVPAPPELPDEPPLEPPPCPRANEAGISKTAVTNTSVFDRMMFLPLGANARCCDPFRTAPFDLP